MNFKLHFMAVVASLVVAPVASQAAYAETSEVRMATQFGIGAMPMIIIEQKRLLEKHLAAEGLPNVKVTWRQFPGGNPMNEGLLSGSLDIVSAGTTVFVTLWAKAKGTPVAVRGIGAVSAMPLLFVTRDPKVQKLQDLDDNDRIAVTTLKVSVHAILLQMAAEKMWGPSEAGRFDKLTVQLPHGDAAAALMSGASEVNNHFSAPPFQEVELKKPGLRRITSAQEILGGPASYFVAYTTEKFRKDNPKIYKAFFDALQDAQAMINNDPEGMASVYLDQSKDPVTVGEAVALIKEPGAIFDMTPRSVQTFAAFMAKRGLTKVAPESWKDLFFPEAHNLPGN
jgi:NitT/TauT family transport system substrate-binding protein